MDNINDEIDNLDNQEEELTRFKLLLDGTIKDECDVLKNKSLDNKSPEKRPSISKTLKK